MKPSRVAKVASDTTDPATGLRAVMALRTLTNTLELRQVEAALRAGMTWQQIADALGITRQAVHKKYAKRVDPTIPLPTRASEAMPYLPGERSDAVPARSLARAWREDPRSGSSGSRARGDGIAQRTHKQASKQES